MGNSGIGGWKNGPEHPLKWEKSELAGEKTGRSTRQNAKSRNWRVAEASIPPAYKQKAEFSRCRNVLKCPDGLFTFTGLYKA